MQSVNINNPTEVRTVGLKALKDALGPVGMAKFIQQYDSGSGDYTKERQEEPEPAWEEIDALLRSEH